MFTGEKRPSDKLDLCVRVDGSAYMYVCMHAFILLILR